MLYKIRDLQEIKRRIINEIKELQQQPHTRQNLIEITKRQRELYSIQRTKKTVLTNYDLPPKYWTPS